MSFEDSFLNNLDRSMRRKEASPSSDMERVARLHETLLKKIDRERPDPSEFEDSVDAEEIKEETSLVAELEARWEKENDKESTHAKNLADIAEFAIHSAIGNWADAKINSLLASKPDDYLRKVDLLIEILKESDSSFLAVGIDVVVTGKYNTAGLETKLAFLKKEVKAGKECLVKYVESESFKGSVNAPRAVIALSSEHMDDYIRMLESNKFDEMHDHITKYIIAYQLQTQYHQLYRVAHKLGHEKMATDYAEANNAAFEVFETLFAEIQKDVRLSAKVSADSGVRTISGFMDLFAEEVEH